MWEFSDEDIRGEPASIADVRRIIFERKLGLQAAGRPAGQETWSPLAQRPEFWTAFPQLEFRHRERKKLRHRSLLQIASGRGALPSNVAGRVLLTRHLFRLDRICENVLQKPEFQKLSFFLPLLAPSAPTVLERNTHLFQLWDDFFVAPLVESVYVKPEDPFRFHLFAINLSQSAQQHRITVSGLEFQRGDEAFLEFSLKPWHWDVHFLAGFGQGRPGEERVSFKTASVGARLAKGVAVTALTLGSVVYAPGVKGFSLGYKVLEPSLAQSVLEHREVFIETAEDVFGEKQATALEAQDGSKFPRQEILEGFARYLTAEVVVSGIRAITAERSAAAVGLQLFWEYAMEEYGVRVPESLVP